MQNISPGTTPGTAPAEVRLTTGPEGHGVEIPAVAAAEARSTAAARVGSLADLARARLVTVARHTPLAEVAVLLSNTQISLAVVCDDDGAAVGVITDTLVVRQFGQRQAGAVTVRADAVMAQDFVACRPDEPLADVLALMHRRGLLHMPVVDDHQRPIGVINARDGLRALLAAGNHEEALLRDYVMGIGYQ